MPRCDFLFVSVILISAWKAAQAMDVEALQRADATKFKEAGLGAVPKTYPYDPTKVKKVAVSKASKGAWYINNIITANSE